MKVSSDEGDNDEALVDVQVLGNRISSTDHNYT